MAETPSAANGEKERLQFHGGMGALFIPFGVMIVGIAIFALQGAALPEAYWVVMLAAILVGLILAKKKDMYIESLIGGDQLQHARGDPARLVPGRGSGHDAELGRTGERFGVGGSAVGHWRRVVSSYRFLHLVPALRVDRHRPRHDIRSDAHVVLRRLRSRS